jgi:RNA polymerase sigma-70 factor (ECF subfamily)
MSTQRALSAVPTVGTGERVRMAEHELAELIRLHRGPLFAHVLCRTFGDRQLAEDITQETLLRAWQWCEPAGSAHKAVRPWLYAVARNLIVDNYRAKRARPAEVLDQRVENRPAQVDQMGRADAAHDMAAALATLTERQRSVLVEVYYRGCPMAEVAVKFGIPLGTVKSRVYSALRALRPLVQVLDDARRAGDDRVLAGGGQDLAYSA